MVRYTIFHLSEFVDCEVDVDQTLLFRAINKDYDPD